MIAAHSRNILIADDSLFYREKLRDILTEAGHSVRFAFDGAGVIEELRKSTKGIDLLLLDLQMPHVNGFRVLDWINENDMKGRFPVLCITAEYDTEEISHRVIDELGADGLITKDLSPEEAVFYVNKFIFTGKSDCRRSARVFLNSKGHFKIGRLDHDCAITNISSDGAFLNTPVGLSRGSIISVWFTLPDNEDFELAVRGEVQWVTKGDRKGNRFSGAGIKFRRLSQRSKRLLDHFLTSGDAKLHYAL